MGRLELCCYKLRNSQKSGEGPRAGPPSQSPDTLISDLWPPELCGSMFLLFELLVCGPPVLAAQAS